MIITPALRRALKSCVQNYPDPLAEKVRLKGLIEHRAEDGVIAFVYGFRDCDMVQVRTNYLYDGAEGPVWWSLERPSYAALLRPSSRDLALEAFEDGHAHVVYV